LNELAGGEREVNQSALKYGKSGGNRTLAKPSEVLQALVDGNLAQFRDLCDLRENLASANTDSAGGSKSVIPTHPPATV